MSTDYNPEENSLSEVLTHFVEAAALELESYWGATPLDLVRAEEFEVLGGLMARQVSLARSMAGAPPVWTPHAAPVFLRAMIDAYITMAWILREPGERAKLYVSYGLGQEKLYLEHLKARSAGRDDTKEAIDALEAWIDSQRFTFLTEVNIGSWAGVPIREQAIEANLKDLYDMAYAPFSAASHSMWNHVARYNLEYCLNPLHGPHRVPIDPLVKLDPHYLALAAKYLERVFKAYCEHFGIPRLDRTAFAELNDGFRSLNERQDGHEGRG